MQVLLHGKPVQEETTKDILLEIVADRYSRAILEATRVVSKSALELSIDCGIPISTAYRRVQQLHTHKILGISGSINKDGKKHFLYRAKIKSVVACFNNGLLDIEIIPNPII
ncbi:conserved protein of unknown function [Nitrosotalea devaniterrae]|uniref:Transcriptional regulator n=1 Tax=Nitrosotalea devaniterrae TaxID=1078905 RepID=A0A128A4B7_9ARCH|nr:conserved protein of unknown function [Candidatus Nitrosotalea devanaterra]